MPWQGQKRVNPNDISLESWLTFHWNQLIKSGWARNPVCACRFKPIIRPRVGGCKQKKKKEGDGDEEEEEELMEKKNMM